MQTPSEPVMKIKTTQTANACHEKKKGAAKANRWTTPIQMTVGQSIPICHISGEFSRGRPSINFGSGWPSGAGPCKPIPEEAGPSKVGSAAGAEGRDTAAVTG